MKNLVAYFNVLLLSSVLSGSDAMARSVLAPDNAVSYARADMVADIRIIGQLSSTATVECGVIYEAEIIRLSKGGITRTRLTFGFLDGLETDKAYTIYLAAATNHDPMRGILLNREWSEAQAEIFLEHCAGKRWDYYFFRSEPHKQDNAIAPAPDKRRPIRQLATSRPAIAPDRRIHLPRRIAGLA